MKGWINADMCVCCFCAEWNFVAINAGYGDSGFFFNESGLQWNEFPGEFGGWLGESFFSFSFSGGGSSSRYSHSRIVYVHV